MEQSAGSRFFGRIEETVLCLLAVTAARHRSLAIAHTHAGSGAGLAMTNLTLDDMGDNLSLAPLIRY
jgi:hypothetical protein